MRVKIPARRPGLATRTRNPDSQPRLSTQTLNPDSPQTDSLCPPQAPRSCRGRETMPNRPRTQPAGDQGTPRGPTRNDTARSVGRAGQVGGRSAVAAVRCGEAGLRGGVRPPPGRGGVARQDCGAVQSRQGGAGAGRWAGVGHRPAAPLCTNRHDGGYINPCAE